MHGLLDGGDILIGHLIGEHDDPAVVLALVEEARVGQHAQTRADTALPICDHSHSGPFRIGLPGNGQLVYAIDARVILERHLVERNGESQVRDTAEQSTDRDLDLDPGQVLPKTLMHSVAERQVVPGTAADVQLLGIREYVGIPVGGAYQRDDPVTFTDGHAAYRDVPQRHAVTGEVGRHAEVAQQLLDRRG